MKILLVLLLMLCSVAAQTTRALVRDSSGRIINQIERVNTNTNVRTTVRDSTGRIISTEQTASSPFVANTVYRDVSGRATGSASTNNYGRTTYRDVAGRIIGTAETSSSGSVTYRDSTGRIVQRLLSSGVLTDASGRRIATITETQRVNPIKVPPKP